MSWFSKLTGADARRNKQYQSQWAPYGGAPDQQLRRAAADEMSGAGWEQAYGRTAGAALSGALPGLRNSLQLNREDAIRRGVSGGDYAPSTDADLAMGWERNIGEAFAGQALNAFEGSRGRYLDLITGQLDREASARNAAKNRSASLWGAGINAVGNLAGGRFYK